MSKEIHNLNDLMEKLKDPEFAEQYKKNWDFSHYKTMVFDRDKKGWTEEPDPIMDEFDKTLKMLHESTHDEKIRESILLVQRYKTEYLDNKKTKMSDKKLSKEEIEDIEYLQKNLFKSLKIPLHLHGLKEDDVVGVKSLEITKQNKNE